MNRVEIPEKRILVHFPSELNEMNQRQFAFFVKQVLRCQSGEISLEDFRILVTYKLLNLRFDRKFYLLSKDEQDNCLGEIYRISLQLESFFSMEDRDGKKTRVFKLDLVKNIIPVICKRYHGPADGLTDITFCEYRIAHNALVTYMKSQHEDDLNHLIAILYRPRKRWLFFRRLFSNFNGRDRNEITARSNPLSVERRKRRIAKLPIEIRYGIYLFFAGCEDFLTRGRPLIDGVEIDLSVLYEKSDEDQPSNSIGLTGLLYSLAESKVFGSIDQTDDQNLYDVLLRLYQVVMQMKEIERKYGSHKTVS